jgi:hypothetical protein
MNSTLFRTLVAVDFLLLILTITIAFLHPHDLPAAESLQGKGALIDFPGPAGDLDPSLRLPYIICLLALAAFIILLTLATQLGLFLFWNWARYAYLAFTILALAIEPLSGWTALSPWDSLLDGLSLLLQGVIICACFSPPIARRFRHRKSQQPG